MTKKKKIHIFQQGEKHQLTWAMVLDLQEMISPLGSSTRKAESRKPRPGRRERP